MFFLAVRFVRNVTTAERFRPSAPILLSCTRKRVSCGFLGSMCFLVWGRCSFDLFVFRNCDIYFWFLYMANLNLQEVKRCRSKATKSGIGTSWPDRCCAPSRTAIAREARDGLEDGVWSAYMKAKIIRLYKPFWCAEELRWARRVIPRPPVPRAANNPPVFAAGWPVTAGDWGDGTPSI